MIDCKLTLGWSEGDPGPFYSFMAPVVPRVGEAITILDSAHGEPTGYVVLNVGYLVTPNDQRAKYPTVQEVVIKVQRV